MCASLLGPSSPLPPRIAVVCLGGLLLGSLLGTGCTPSSSGPSPTPDTTAVTTATSSPTEKSPAASSPTPSAAPTTPDVASRTVAQRLDDASVAARVKQALVRPSALRRFDFSPTVVRGRLTLRGDVNTREQYREAERIATNVEGVTAITNQVTVEGQAASKKDNSGKVAYHTVRRGDTLWKIAREYDVSVRQIRALNDLSGSLQPDERVRVR